MSNRSSLRRSPRTTFRPAWSALVTWLLPALALLVGACGGDDPEEGPLDTAAGAVTFEGEVAPLAGFSFDTGLIPKGSPVAASLKLAAGGKVKVKAAGAVTSGELTGNKGGGEVALDVHFTMAGRIKVDSPLAHFDEELPGLKNIDVPITGKVAFDPFLLDDRGEATVVAAIPETKLPPIPLGSVPGKLELTVTKESTLRSTFHGGCLAVEGGQASYRGQLKTSGKLVLKGTILVDLPPPLNVPVDLGVIAVDIPESSAPLDLGTKPAPGAANASNGSSCTAGSRDGGGGGGDSSNDPDAPPGTGKTFSGTLAQTSPPAAFGGADPDGGLPYCSYQVALQNVSVAVTVDGTSVVAATVSDQPYESLREACAYPAAPPSTQTFTLPTPTPVGAQLVLSGASTNKPEATLVIDLVASGDGYDATLRWHRTDLGPPLDWRVTAEVHLLAK